MGSVLLMLLALVLPVAPAGAVGNTVEDEGTVRAAAVPPNALFDDCAPSTNDRTGYFLTLNSTMGTRIPAINGGIAATVTLVGVGTANLGQSIPMVVGDLENRANPGIDLGSGQSNAAPPVLGPPNGSCLDIGDSPPGTLDSFLNDYGTQSPVQTTLTTDAFRWSILISAPGHISQFIGTVPGVSTLGISANGQPLVDGQTTAATGFGGTGCTRPDRGCVVSLGTITLTALGVPNAGRGSISGTVRDTSGLPLGGVDVVIYRQTDQDPQNDATGPIAENTAFSVLTDPATGQFFVNNLWPGRYSVTVGDTRLRACNPIAAQTLSTNCGVQPATKVINLFPGANVTDPQQQATVDFTTPTDIVGTQAPGQAIGSTSLTGLFGYVVDGSTGGRIGTLVPGTAGFNPFSGSGGTIAGFGVSDPRQAIITFTPTQPAGCAQQIVGTQTNCLGAVQATTDANGRYQVILVAGVAYVATIQLPLGFQGSCTVGGNLPGTGDRNVSFDGPLFQCGVGLNGQDRFAIGATTLIPGGWNGGGTFILAPTTATQIAPNGQTIVRRLEAVIPGIYRNPDTSYTGVDIETIQVRIMNNGVMRTGAQIEWYSTSSDDVASLVKTDTLDLNAGSVGIFTRAIIPDGCTRCMAQIYSIDLDAPSPFLGPGFLPSNTPPIPGQNGIVYGLSDLQATVTHRVVDAGNALAGGNGITFEDIFPTGATNNSGWIIPLVYKNYGGGVNKWSSLVTGCLTRGVAGPQPIVFEFWANGETRGGPYNITRSTNPGGCLSLNLNTFDPNDPDYFDPLMSLPDGTYSVYVTSTAGLPVPLNPEFPGGFFATAMNYSTTGRMATLANGSAPLGNEDVRGQLREYYAPLVFKRYNDWNSGITVANFRPRTSFGGFGNIAGGSGAGISIAIYGEDATLHGVFLDRLGNLSSKIYYLPTLPIQLPDGFRGSSIIAIGDNTAGTRSGASVQTVNYERNQAVSYNFIAQDQATGVQTPNGRPCSLAVNNVTDPTNPAIGPPAVQNPFGIIPNPTAYQACLFVADAERRFGGGPRGSGATFEVGLGPTTGVRLFNPDPYKNGAPAYVVASYLDSSGVIFTDSYTTFSIPSYGTGTIFMGADARLPDIYDGSMIIQSTGPIVGIGQVVDYRITDRDASYAFNLPNQTGRTN